MSFRTLTFGDRTISYDTGLNSLPPGGLLLQQQHEAAAAGPSLSSDLLPSRKISVDPQQDDDGIGSSDDETLGSTASSSTVATLSEEVPVEDIVAHAEEEEESGDDLKGPQRRKLIHPDQSAINQLLAFDEEEEDDYEEEEDDEEEGSKKSSPTTTGGGGGWHKTIVKDLANLSSPTGSNQLQRRHSISVCESSSKRKNSSSSSASSSNSSSPKNLSPRHSRTDPPLQSLQLNVSRVNNLLLQQQQEEERSDDKASRAEALQTLNLKLDEVAHIRSVLTKAELEGSTMDGNMKADVQRGKVCFLCLKTKFGLFSRGSKCEMCKQLVCHRCHSKMKIPLDHFSNTPVFALRPQSSSSNNNSSAGHQSSQQSPSDVSNGLKEKKQSLPDSLGLLLDHKSVGSAPNSPRLSQRQNYGQDLVSSEEQQLPTISGGVTPAFGGPVSLPPQPLKSKYATLPTKSRRLSLMSSRDADREKLEGSLLTVCTDCKDMVLQVIRASRTTRRMQMVRSVFLSFSPESSVREHRL